MEELWLSHKETIRDLYLVKDMTRQDVMSKMEEFYGFKASAGQYERKFKKWGFRKNLTLSEWQLVSQRIDKRKRDGKETNLRIDGIPVPPKKLNRAMQRHGQGPPFNISRERYRSLTPPTGVSFSPPPTYSLSPDLYTLPWQAFSSFVSSMSHANPEFVKQLSETQARVRLRLNVEDSPTNVPKLDANVTMSFLGLSVVPGFADFIFSAFVATNHVRNPSRPSVVRALCTLRTPNVLQTLKALGLKHEPALDALSQLLFKEALLSQDLNLTASLLKTFVFNMADLLPGPWPYTKPGSALWRLRNDQDARPPLQVAIETGNIKLVRNLIDHGADVNVVGAGGRDMFNVAAAVRSEDILDLLLESVQEISLPSLLACLAHGFFDHASRIWPQIKGLISVHEKLETEMLTGAVRAGHIPLVKDLLENGADPNAFNKAHQSPLQLASESDGDCLAIAEILVKWGAEPDFRFDDGDDDLRMPTPLQNAARRNNFAVAAFLIDKGADPNAESVCDDTDDTLYKEWGFYAYDCCTLNVALRAESDTRMIELLLEAGADPDDATLSDALEYHNDPQIFRLLMRHDAPLSSVLFFYAARAGNIGVVQLCLDAGMDPNEIYSGKTALEGTLQMMIEDGENVDEQSWEMCTFLLERGADVNLHNIRPALSDALRITANTGKRDFVEHFLSRGAHCDNPDVLREAVGTGDSIVLERILDAAATRPGFKRAFMTSCLGHEALCKAAESNHVEATKSLVSRGVNLKSACATKALQSACESTKPHSDVVGVLLTGGVPPNYSQCCESTLCADSAHSHLHPVQLLARAGHAEGVQSLLSYGANPNLYGSEWKRFGCAMCRTYTSVLSSAAEGGNQTIVKKLLKAGAEANLPARGRFGKTALQSAAQHGHNNVVELLIDEGANVNAEPSEYAGVTALQAAAIGGFVGIAAKLIEHGADVNAPAAKKEGRTALEGASEHGRIDMVELLVQAGADLRAAQYKNALVFARKNGFGAVARLLERRLEDG